MRNRAMYVALGLEPGAPSDEIKRAYRNISMKLHPDSSRDPNTARRFAKVARAYKELSVAVDSTIGFSGIERSPLDHSNPERNQAQGSRTAHPLAGPKPPGRQLAEPKGNDVFSLGSILTGTGTSREKASAARLLGLSGRRSVWIFLRKGLYDLDPVVVGACVRAIGVLGLAQGAAEIACAYERSGPEVKDSILEAARATEDPVFKAAMQTALSDEDPRRRAIAKRITMDA